jgi:hypothetical protein
MSALLRGTLRPSPIFPNGLRWRWFPRSGASGPITADTITANTNLTRTPIDQFRLVLIAKSDIDQSDIGVDREILFRRSASLEAETNCGRYLEAGLSRRYRMILECEGGNSAVLEVALVVAVSEARRDIS